MIVDGRLLAGSRINEVQLSRQLAVSRTPLREALMLLVSEGALTLRPRLGFFVKPLTAEEFEQIYPMRALLDPEALRLAGIPTPAALAKLTAINEEIQKATRGRQLLVLDDRFHLELVATCTNRVLLGLIEHFIRRTRRYELALMRARAGVGKSADEHEAILAKLRRGDLRGACEALRKNMQSGRGPIVNWLLERRNDETTSGSSDAARGRIGRRGRDTQTGRIVGRAARLRP
jgi:DNA-binding GntR family transcriptional regulator